MPTEQQQRKVQGESTSSGHKMSGQHREHLHNPTGYTDEVANEEREFMQQAERSAGQGGNTGQSQGINTSSRSAGQGMKQKGGLESQQQQGSSMGSNKGSNIGQQASSTMENIKNKAKGGMGME